MAILTGSGGILVATLRAPRQRHKRARQGCQQKFGEGEEKSRILRPSKTKLFEHLIYEDWLVLLFWIPFQ